MPSRIAISGHPLHPYLVLFPVGLFAWAFISMIVFAADGTAFWYDIAFWTSWAAVVAALIAGLAGFADYQAVARYHVPTTATAHMLLNVAVTAAFVAAGILMLDRGAAEGGAMTLVLALQGTGVLLLAVSGWLGQEMVYRHGMGVTPEAAAELQETRGQVRPTAGQPR